MGQAKTFLTTGKLGRCRKDEREPVVAAGRGPRALWLPAQIPEGFHSAVANYVESGIVSEGLPDSFTQQIDLSNSNKLWEYEQIVTEQIQREVDAYNKTHGTAFRDVHSCKSYADDETYEHYRFCYDVWQWNKQVWQTTRQIMQDVTTGAIEPPDENEFVAMLPAFTT